MKRFNGEFFRNHAALRLEPRGDRRAAGRRPSYNWKEVDPAIFGTLLEQALDPRGARRGSAPTTRRAPMSSGWWLQPSSSPCAKTGRNVQATAESQARLGGLKGAAADGSGVSRQAVRDAGTRPRLRHRQLPLRRAGADEAAGRRGTGSAARPRRPGSAARWIGSHSVDPHQFLGIEKQPASRGDRRAGALARLPAMALPHQGRGDPDEPILRDVQEHSRSWTRC